MNIQRLAIHFSWMHSEKMGSGSTYEQKKRQMKDEELEL